MIRYLAIESITKLNMFPNKGGISSYYSPRQIMGLPNLDYTKHLSVSFGTYVQVNREPNPTNTNEARTYDAIYLRAATNLQGGHEVMDLNSGRV